MPRKLSAQVQRQIIKLYTAGRTIREIAEKVGSHHSAVHRILMDHEVPRRRTGPRSKRSARPMSR